MAPVLCGRLWLHVRLTAPPPMFLLRGRDVCFGYKDLWNMWCAVEACAHTRVVACELS